MYSKRISELLSSIKAGLGDSVELTSNGTKIEGEVMPSTESNNPNILIIKMKSGYNVGISPFQYKIKKLERKKSITEFPKAKLKVNPELNKISLIYTGGTIGSRVDYKTGAVYMLTKPEELLYEVPEISEIANISIVPLLSVASEDMTHMEWKKIANSVADELNKGSRGIIITHGTDTMHYTAAALTFMLKGLNAPVVLTGSQRSSDRGSSDAFLNLICSANIAAKSDIAEVGICMHSTSSDTGCHFIRGTKARKMHTSRRDAFRPINCRPIAHIKHTGSIEYSSEYRKTIKESGAKIKPTDKFEPKVALIKTYPNADPGIIDFYIKKNYKGLIIEGTGLGHAPVSTPHKEYNWLPAIRKAIIKGLVVGMASQSVYGRVNPNVYRNLRILSSLGVIYCQDMTSETALVKLGWLIGNYGKDGARSFLDKNIAGEINHRIDYDAFLV